MSLFQKSVTNKYLKNLDTEKVDKAFENFQKFYSNKVRLANIMQLKEENYQEGFLREIFVETLGYIINPDENYNLTTELKNQKDARKADGAILKNGKAIGVIELKSTKIKNLESIKEQAFGYKNNQPDCKYVITSNFQSLRFYVDNATEYEEFNLFQLDKKQFKLLYLLLSKESIFSDLPEKLKQETKFHENNISTQLYADYKHFKDKIFENLIKNNPQYDKLTLFKKSQKLLDRFLFIFFAEDSGLIPPNAVSKIVEQWKVFIEEDEYFTLYSRFQKLFRHLDKGHNYKKWGEIPAYNGGLFRNDEILDTDKIKIDDEILEKDSLKLSKYDFNTEVDVNILGHIFEHSLNEIEEMEQKLTGLKDLSGLPKVSKRKKDGVFYTPKYITKYIVENTVGTLCNEKKEELQINNLLIDKNYRKKDGKINEKGKKLFKTLNNYKDWLITLKILDPACGSGAFLNQTLDFLIAEHKQTDDLIAELTGENLRLFDTDKAILENNIYGVDINEESVEIAKLSLWLRTAQKGRKLSDLSGNIKCGNSLIDDPEIAGNKAFNWEKEFPQVFNSEITEKVYQKLPETKPNYIKLIKEKSKEAQEKAEQSAKLSKEAVEISKQVYEYAGKLDTINEPETSYGVRKGGFDVVLGNPPYVRLQGIKANYETESYFYEQNYQSATSNYDIYALFIEKSFQLINDSGKVGFILPHKFLISEFGKGVRSYLAENKAVEQLVHFGSDMVFADASTYTCILTLSKNNEKLHFQHISPLKINEKFLFDEIEVSKLSVYQWILTDRKTAIVLKKIKKQNNTLKNVFHRFVQGIITGKDAVFCVKGNLKGSYLEHIDNNGTVHLLEKQILKPHLRGLDIGKFQNLHNSEWLIFPYKLVDEKAILYTENEMIHHFPNTWKYLQCFEVILRERERKRFDTENWYQYSRNQAISVMEQPKIITPEICFGGSMTIDENNFYHNSKCHTLLLSDNSNYSLKSILPIINSKLFWFFASNTGNILRGGYIGVKRKLLETFPVPKAPKNQQPFIEKADLMLSLNKKLQTKSEKFIKRIKSNLEIKKITNKLQNFYNFDFKTFVSELKKQKIKLNLTQQDEWEDYFDNYKTEINNIQNQIKQTDKEIDKMVYKLYELTAEEIEIVENSVK